MFVFLLLIIFSLKLSFSLESMNEKKFYHEIIYYEQTIVLRYLTDRQRKLFNCDIYEVYEEKYAKETLRLLGVSFNATIQNSTMNEMLVLMEQCDALDNNVKRNFFIYNQDNNNNFSSLTNYHEEEINAETITIARYGLIGIVPGTKWCGPGNNADGYHDLGKLRDTDRCCRSHDFCPIKILAKDDRYGLKNSKFYTQSHCTCDELFYACLKKNKSFVDKTLGEVYFNLLSPDCIDGLPEYPERKMQFVSTTQKW